MVILVGTFINSNRWVLTMIATIMTPHKENKHVKQLQFDMHIVFSVMLIRTSIQSCQAVGWHSQEREKVGLYATPKEARCSTKFMLSVMLLSTTI